MEHFTCHGKDWNGLSQHIGTKSAAQIKNYYQNYKNRLGLGVILARLNGGKDVEDADAASAQEDKPPPEPPKQGAGGAARRGEGGSPVHPPPAAP
ncbi:hypothetical protein JKP88DRAFT_206476, partial [Tribonema minus]